MEIYQANRACPCLRCRAQGLMAPVVLITLGVLFLLQELRIFAFHRSWPLLLIAIGIVVLLRHGASTTGHVPPSSSPVAPANTAPSLPRSTDPNISGERSPHE